MNLKVLISKLRMVILSIVFWVIYGVILGLFFAFVVRVGAGLYYGVKFAIEPELYFSVAWHGAIIGLGVGVVQSVKNLLPNTIDKRFSAWVDKHYGPIDGDDDKSEKNGKDK